MKRGHWEEVCQVASWWWLTLENLYWTRFSLDRLEEEAEKICTDKRMGRAERKRRLDELEFTAAGQCTSLELLQGDRDDLIRRARKLLKTKTAEETDMKLREFWPVCGARGLLREFVPKEVWMPKEEVKRRRGKVAGLHG